MSSDFAWSLVIRGELRFTLWNITDRAALEAFGAVRLGVNSSRIELDGEATPPPRSQTPHAAVLAGILTNISGFTLAPAVSLEMMQADAADISIREATWRPLFTLMLGYALR